jgi:hypothetical protein
MWEAVGINLLSDLIFSGSIFIITLCVYLIFQRVRILKFFGVDKSKKITIFTSNLIVEMFGSTGNDGIPYSFQGTAIPYEESKAASQIHNLFNYFLPSQFEKPGLVSKILISDIDAKVLPAPKSTNVIEQNSTVISLGFPPYNIISKLIEETYNATAKLNYIKENSIENYEYLRGKLEKNYASSSDNSAGTIVPSQLLREISVMSSVSFNATRSFGDIEDSSEQIIKALENANQIRYIPAITIPNFHLFTDTYIGFIQKIVDTKNKRFFFYIAGLSEYATAGSAYYLVDNWKDLQKMYGNDSPFCVLVKVSSTNIKSSQLIYKS